MVRGGSLLCGLSGTRFANHDNDLVVGKLLPETLATFDWGPGRGMPEADSDLPPTKHIRGVGDLPS